MHPNRLLNLLAPGDIAKLSPHLRRIELHGEQVLAEPFQEIKEVYFPHSGIISFVVEMSDGHMVETGMVGRDGVMGAIQVFAGKVSQSKVIVQVPGEASVIDANQMQRAVADQVGIRTLLAMHEQFFIAQVQQSVGCNATHHVEPRVCRWLARMYDLVGPEFPLTQEFLAQMIGVRRTSVSMVAGKLQEAGLIAYRRGQIQILDVPKLKASSCECYAAVKVQYEKLFPAQGALAMADADQEK
jgi:CRP-like cAMP-binding protein